MKNQRDAILGYAKDLHAYYIQLIEDNIILDRRYGLVCDSVDEERADSIMMTLILKKSYWLNGSDFNDTINGLQPITSQVIH